MGDNAQPVSLDVRDVVLVTSAVLLQGWCHSLTHGVGSGLGVIAVEGTCRVLVESTDVLPSSPVHVGCRLLRFDDLKANELHEFFVVGAREEVACLGSSGPLLAVHAD